ncbi:MAG: CocE/NonD family hydrolase [Longimicrobiales bacterium]
MTGATNWLATGLTAGLCAAATACVSDDAPTFATPQASEFGKYEGYGEPQFDSWVRTSEYIVVEDGTRLAADVVRPARNGIAVDTIFPVIWTHSRYHRTPANLAALLPDSDPDDDSGVAPPSDGTQAGAPLISFVDVDQGLQRLVRHGYAFVAVAVRGSGASFGRYEGLFSPAETDDAYDVMDWIVDQPWSDGNLGMWGGSYLGITQYMAASAKHPALKAIFPQVALFDLYDAVYPGGVYRADMIEHWGLLTRSLDTEVTAPPVDDDPSATQLAAAVLEHQDSWAPEVELRGAPMRDHRTTTFDWSRHSPTSRLDSMNASGVAAYHWGGWYDAFSMDEALWFRNWTGPDLLGMGPWFHTAPAPEMEAERAQLEAVEQHRFFDHFLKGVDNGIMDEAAVRYAVVDDFESWSWAFADDWPPPNATATYYYFAGGPSGTVESANDGILSTAQSLTEGEADEYQVDPTTTTGTRSRWDNAVGQGAMAYPDLSSNGARSLTYTTPPLPSDITIAGHPIATLFIAADAADADLYVLLEEVTPDGVSRYVTEGVLRASHRAIAKPSWDNLELPYQSSTGDGVSLLIPGEVAELVLDLQPTATLFNTGNRLRITIMGADADNTEAPPHAPRVLLYRSGEYSSRISLPILN